MEERELQGIRKPLGAMGKKTPLNSPHEIEPLPVLDAHRWYYRSGERYYRLSGSSSQQ